MQSPRTFRRIAIYCGSSSTVNPAYIEEAHSIGVRLAQKGIGVVYGGGKVGLMGAVANGALEAGGEVLGVTTEKLFGMEVAHPGLSELHVAKTMHERKRMMCDLADGFIALPGGFGTYDELFEAATWTQLNDHIKPVGLYNYLGFYEGLISFLGHAQSENFIRPTHGSIVQADADLDGLLQKMATCELPILGTWKP